MHKRYSAIIFIIAFILSLSTLSFSQQQETLTITTYYPSPYGSYRDLRAQQMAIGNTYYLSSTYCWAPDTCTNILSDNTDLVVEGNVGIGTAAPGYQLQLGSNSGTTAAAKIFVNQGAYNTWGGGLAISPDGNSTVAGLVSAYFDTTNNIQKLSLGTIGYSGVAQTMVLQNGNVGIGTTGPGAALHVSSATNPQFIMQGASDRGGMLMRDSAGTQRVRFGFGAYNYTGATVADVGLGSETGGKLFLGTAGDNIRVTIDTSGNVGIGTTAPANLLEIGSHSSAANRAIAIKTGASQTSKIGFWEQNEDVGLSIGYDGGTNKGFLSRHNGSSARTDVITIDGPTGNVGIGTTGPGDKLEVAGNIRLSPYGSSYRATSTGGVTKTGFTGYQRSGAVCDPTDSKFHDYYLTILGGIVVTVTKESIGYGACNASGSTNPDSPSVDTYPIT